MLLFWLACASREVREARSMEGHYQLGALDAGWVAVKPGGADFAWRNAELSAVIYADSNCGVRMEDGRLEDLAEHQTAGILTRVTAQKTVSIDEREAMILVGEGRLDGVDVQLATMVMNKDFCTYDVVLIAPPGRRFDQARADFEAAVGDFRTTGN